MIDRILVHVALATLLAAPLAAQSKFEVADVHVSAPGTKRDGGFMAGGRIEMRGIPMLELISDAYGVDTDLIIGGPAWLTTDQFDITAKAPAGVTSEEKLPAMLKVLLEERFKLVAHMDKKDLPVFIMTAKSGAKLTKAAKDGLSRVVSVPGDSSMNNHLKFTGMTMEALAGYLPEAANNFVNHPVVDETHLKGAFDFQLDWMGINIYRRAKANPDGPPAVGVFEALQKLGLELKPGTRSLPVVIVESVNQVPTPNTEGVTAKIPAFPAEFEVAEVRLAKPISPPPPRPPGPRGLANEENGRLEVQSATLSGLITLAFDIDARLLMGAPKWMDEERFDLIAKSAPNLPDEVTRGMIRKVLLERFHLVTHNEEQAVPVYVLLAGKSPKLKLSDGAARSECRIENTDRRYYICQNTTVAQFVERLPMVAAAYLHPPVLDLTQIQGAYDFRLYWTPKGQLSTPSAAPIDAATTPVDETTVFEAVDKQLGLKLEEQKHPAQVLVVDKVERLAAAQ